MFDNWYATIMYDTAALFQVVLIDLALAGDNAVAVALAAAALPAAQQKRVIFWGIGAALLLRIAFALATVQLLRVPGLLIVGALLLLWVAFRLWRDMQKHESGGEEPSTAVEAKADFRRALTSIIIADVSMSLDNVLAVAGVAHKTPVVLAIGLILSVVLMGVAAGFIAKLMAKHRWIGLVGVVIIVIAALQMLWEGAVVHPPWQTAN